MERLYARIWLHLPKYVAAILIFIEVAILVGGNATWAYSSAAWEWFRANTDGGTRLLILFSSGLAICGLGVFVALLLREGLAAVTIGLSRAVLTSRPRWVASFPGVLLPRSAQVVRLLNKDKQFLVDYVVARSATQPDTSQEQEKFVRDLMTRISKSLMKPEHHEFIAELAHATSLTQDQRKYELLEDQMRTFEMFGAALLLYVWISALGYPGAARSTAGALLVFVLLCLLIAAWMRLRRRLVRVLAWAYIEIFVVAEGADIEDREGEGPL